jgi:hypothetical protein
MEYGRKPSNGGVVSAAKWDYCPGSTLLLPGRPLDQLPGEQALPN